jgi:hypothetical protein
MDAMGNHATWCQQAPRLRSRTRINSDRLLLVITSLPDEKGTVEDSPEQILARLTRHRDSLIRANRLQPAPARPLAEVARRTAPPAPWSAHPPATTAPILSPAPAPVPRAPGVGSVDVVPRARLAIEPGWKPAHSPVVLTLFGLFLSVVACVLAVIVFARFDNGVASGVVAGMALLGVYAAIRRAPGALWWTAGAVIGGCLALVS